MSPGKTDIWVFAHWRGMHEPKCIGVLSAHQAKGRKAFGFEYDPDWIQSTDFRFFIRQSFSGGGPTSDFVLPHHPPMPSLLHLHPHRGQAPRKTPHRPCRHQPVLPA